MESLMKTNKSSYPVRGKGKNSVIEEYFKDGTLCARGSYRNGEKTGQWKYYLRTGDLRAVGRYSKGKLEGTWKWYRENGELMQTGAFKDQKLVTSG